MEKQPFDILLADKYLDGTISDAELTLLKSQFESSGAFEQEMEIQRLILEAIQYEGNRRVVDKMLPRIEQQLESEGFFTKPQPSKVKPLFPPWAKKAIAVAASILLIALSIWFMLPTAPVDQLATKTIRQEQANTQPVLSAIQEKIDKEIQGWNGVTTEQWRLLKEGTLAFQDGEYRLAEKHLKKFNSIHPKNEIAAFYLALCHYKQADFKQANDLFSETVFKDYKNQATWFKALSLWKMGKKEQAYPLLEQLSQDELYAEEAKLLLGTVQK